MTYPTCDWCVDAVIGRKPCGAYAQLEVLAPNLFGGEPIRRSVVCHEHAADARRVTGYSVEYIARAKAIPG